jgi:hypothetical protein
MKFKSVFTILAMLMIVFLFGCEKTKDPTVPPFIDTPVVNSTNPANNATDVALNQMIIVTFSEPMNQSTITSATVTLMQGSTPVTGVVACSSATATFIPASNLNPGMVYTGTITIGAENVDGTAMASNKTFSFTTGAETNDLVPTIVSTDPASNATGVVLNKIITVTFNEMMNPMSFMMSTFTLMQGLNPVSGTVTHAGMTAKFTPSNLLTAETVYTAKITTAAKDLFGNSLATDTEWSFTTGIATASLAVVDLGSSANYVILAKTAITNVPTSAITGDLAISPAAASYITGIPLTKATGFATSAQVTGKIYAADMAAPTGINLTTAVNNMITAYNDAAGRPFPDFTELYTGNIGGKTLAPGLYKWTNSVTVPSNVTISGTADDVWIFQIAGNLSLSTAVNVILAGGAKASNIFWQVAGPVTLSSTSHFEGIILAKKGVTFQTGASFNGRALSQTSVILDKNTIVEP